jgi:hypothetical protein
MQIISGSNAVYSSADNQSITLDLVADTLGAIPCTVHPNDPPTAQIYADCIAGKYGTIAPYPLTSAQSVQLALMDTEYTNVNAQPISYMGTTFQADAYSQQLIGQVLTASGGSLPSGFQWWDSTNTPVTMSYAQLATLAAQILFRGQGYFAHKQAQKVLIRAATSTTQVQSIVW